MLEPNAFQLLKQSAEEHARATGQRLGIRELDDESIVSRDRIVEPDGTTHRSRSEHAR